ncbi:MAG TPA: MFS transporter [Polyangia bacterium]|jgi:predicted MFS family arabinose efflux permease|nr:MFS transporter [Polyangia bacterium]
MCHNEARSTISALPTAPARTAASPGGSAQVRLVDRLIPAFPRVFWFLWAGMLLNRAGGGVLCWLAVYLTRERGLRADLAGLVLSLHAAGGIIAGPTGGALADRLGRRATLLLGTAGAGVAMLALGFARALGAIFLLAPLLGFFTQICGPPLLAAVADLIQPAQRRRAYGFIYWANNLGFAAAAALGGFLAERHFTWLFVVDAMTTLGYGVIVLLRVPETRPPAAAATSPVISPANGWLAPFRDRALMTLVGIQVPVLVAFTQVLAALPLDMRAHSLPANRIGLLLGLNGVVIVLLQPLALRFLQRVPHVSLLAGGAALAGLGLGAVGLARGSWGYALATVIFTAGEIGFSLAMPPLVAQLAPSDQRGAYQGMHQLSWSVASMLAPMLGLTVLAHAGSATLWTGCLCVGVGAGALHATVTRRQINHSLDRREDREAA